MKKLIALVLFLLCVVSFIGCASQSQPSQSITAALENESLPAPASTPSFEPEMPEADIPILDFSYAEDCAVYAAGKPGVKTSGFVNITAAEADCSNVAEIAENECTIKWDRCTTYLDAGECIWKVVFFTEGMPGADQSVYLDSDGKTVLIVYGE